MEQEAEKSPQKKTLVTKQELIAFAFDVGMSIAVPLVIFAFGGKSLDNYYNTSPKFLIIGLLLSLIATAVTITKKVKSFL